MNRIDQPRFRRVTNDPIRCLQLSVRDLREELEELRSLVKTLVERANALEARS